MAKFDKEKLKKLDEKLKEYGFHNFEKFSLCPTEYNKPRVVGDFEFLWLKKNSWQETLHVAYTGSATELQFLKLNLTNKSTYTRDDAIKLNNKIYNYVATFSHYTRNRCIYTERDFKYSLDSIYRSHLNSYTVNINDIWKEEIASNFKKTYLECKKEWKEAKEKACKDVFNITIAELTEKQSQINGVRDTDYIVSISPKLRALKSDCELLLQELSENRKPSKKIKERFYKSYQAFQNFDPKSNRKHITKIRSL